MDVIVVGAGIVGLSCAWYLRQTGHKVTIVDKGTPVGDRCSLGNSGIIVPSHFVPLAAPGMIWSGMKMLARKDSPFRIKPSLDADLATWCLMFRAHCNLSHVEICAPVLLDMHLQSKSCYKQFAEIWDNGFGFQSKGMLMLCNSEKGLHEESEVAKMAIALGLEAQVLGKVETQELEPDLKMSIKGSVFFPDDAHLSPHVFVSSLQIALFEAGVEFRWGQSVDSLISGAKTGVRIGFQELLADAVIVSAGVSSGRLAKTIELRLPLQPGKGLSFATTNPLTNISRALLLKEARVAVTPMIGGIRFGGTMELGEWNQEVDPIRLSGMKRSILEFLPQFNFNSRSESELPVWTGLRPCSPDGMPYIGATKKAPGIFFATGHGMMGVSLGPITGKLIVDAIDGISCHETLSPDRFDK